MTWFKQAACRGLDPAMFFPERGEPTRPALAICATCPVTNQCLDYCLSLPRPDGSREPAGIWGGTTGNDRRPMHRSRRTA